MMALLSLAGTQASAQVFTLNCDAMIRYTARNLYERFEDGRPKSPDAVRARRDYFSPPQFTNEILKRAETSRIHDECAKMKLLSGKYKSSDLYPSPKDPALKQEYEDYLKKRLGK